MPQRSQAVLEPRKSPLQARSAASVDAIIEATIQVLLQVGKERLTTTKVALRAGVSVGSLYQYFPNKSALLKAALKRHMDEVAEAIELVCHQQRGHSLEQMATALVTTFLEAKLRDAKTSVALYAVSSRRRRSEVRAGNGNQDQQGSRRHVEDRQGAAHDRSSTCRCDAPGRDGRSQPTAAGVHCS